MCVPHTYIIDTFQASSVYFSDTFSPPQNTFFFSEKYFEISAHSVQASDLKQAASCIKTYHSQNVNDILPHKIHGIEHTRMPYARNALSKHCSCFERLNAWFLFLLYFHLYLYIYIHCIYILFCPLGVPLNLDWWSVVVIHLCSRAWTNFQTKY